MWIIWSMSPHTEKKNGRNDMSVLSHFKVFFVIIVGQTPSEKVFALTSETDWLSEHLKNRTDGNKTQLLRGKKRSKIVGNCHIAHIL